MIRATALSFGRALVSMRRRPRAVFLTIASVAAALSLAAVVLWLSDNLMHSASRWRHGADLVVVLENGVDEERVAALEGALADIPAFHRVERIAAVDAYRELETELGPEILKGVDAASLPSIIEIEFRPGIRDVALAHPIVARLEAMDGVEQVEIEEAVFEKLEQAADGIRVAAWFAVAIALGLCFALVFSSMALASQRVAEEARVYRLFGGAESLVARPLIAEGCIVGVVGAALAVLFTMFVHSAVAPGLSGLLSTFFFSEAPLSFLTGERVFMLIGVGALAGSFGAAMALRAHVRG